MSEAGTTDRKPSAAQAAGREGSVQNRIAELKVSGHLMTLDTGLFCVFQAPGSAAANDRSGLPGVRISLPPGPAGRPEAVSISTFRDDGWMDGFREQLRQLRDERGDDWGMFSKTGAGIQIVQFGTLSKTRDALFQRVAVSSKIEKGGGGLFDLVGRASRRRNMPI